MAAQEAAGKPADLLTIEETLERATLLDQQGRAALAEPLYRSVLERNPDHVAALHRLSILCLGRGAYAEAMRLIGRALDRDPDFADAQNNAGIALHGLGRPAEAVRHFERAIRLDPRRPETHYNLGRALQTLDRLEQAAACYERAVALKPDYAEAFCNLGNVLRDLNRHAQAIACCERALALRPNYVDAHLNEGIARLALGDYAAGWKKYEWRLLTPSFAGSKNPMPRPLWLGQSDLAGKTILLHGEQGLGDTIQFARYVPLVARLGARVILAVQRPLAPLFARLEGVAVLRAKGDAIPPFDCYCPLPSLPLAFATTLETVPAEVPYVTADETVAARWRKRLANETGRKVGLVWAGSPQHANDRHRSIALKHLVPLFATAGVRWFSLQVGERKGALARLPAGTIVDLSDDLTDFAETAAAVSALDLVITIDTSVAHVAGALGKPAWVLLPFAADWRWLTDRAESPWYPTARLFRQPAIGDWPTVVTRVAAALPQFRPPMPGTTS